MFKYTSLPKGKQHDESPPLLKVLLVAQQALTLAALSALLQNSAEITVIGQIGIPEQIPATVLQQPMLILLDIDQPTGPDLSIVAPIRHTYPVLPLAISTLFVDHSILYTLLGYSVQAYLTKDLSPQQFIDGLKTVASGGSFFSPTAMAQLQQDGHQKKATLLQAKLTLREQELFHLLCKGISFRAIANQLHLSEQTARNYASQIYEKLGITSKSELIARYGGHT